MSGYGKTSKNTWLSAGKVRCDGLESHPGGVAILLATSCYRNPGKLRRLWGFFLTKECYKINTCYLHQLQVLFYHQISPGTKDKKYIGVIIGWKLRCISGHDFHDLWLWFLIIMLLVYPSPNPSSVGHKGRGTSCCQSLQLGSYESKHNGNKNVNIQRV